MTDIVLRLKALIRSIPDFPKPGIIFRDITTLTADAEALRDVTRALAAPWGDEKIDIVIGVEARGFIFGPAVAIELGAGFAPARKPGKLPYDVMSESYQLEYGSDAVELHADAVAKGQRVLMVDDLLATGGTMGAACRLVEKLGGEIAGVSFVIELDTLNGREKIGDYRIESLVHYEGE